MVLSEMNPLLLELWREKHPQGLEQFALGQNVNSYHDREGKRSFAEDTGSGRRAAGDPAGSVSDFPSALSFRVSYCRTLRASVTLHRIS
jgi:hypothetical protein